MIFLNDIKISADVHDPLLLNIQFTFHKNKNTCTYDLCTDLKIRLFNLI